MSTFPTERRAELARLQGWSLGVGCIAALACAAGAYLDPPAFWRSYLAAYVFYLGIPLGCMAVLMLYYLTGGAWGFMIRRILEANMRTLPLVAVFFVPIAFRLGDLYVWARPEVASVDKDIRNKVLYLNPQFFWVRAALYFVLWGCIAWLLTLWSRQEDRTGDPQASKKLVYLAGPGLVVYGLTITFASVDWVMSLQPGFRSTIFGPLFASSEILSGMTFSVVVMSWLVARPPLAEFVSLEALNDLGNLVFTFLVIWAYLTWFQFMLIWIANLPYDVSWYVPRSHDGWQWVALALAVFGFAIPFFLLLLRDVKRNPQALGRVAALVLLMQLVFSYYQVLPAPVFEGLPLADHWMDLAAAVGLGGFWLAFFLWQLQRCSVLPRHDVNEAAAAQFRRHDEETMARRQEVQHG
jgi:hypothetical protein